MSHIGSTAEIETRRSVKSTKVMPQACQSSVSMRAGPGVMVKDGFFLTSLRRREQCPLWKFLAMPLQRPARALAARPLQPPRGWSWRFDRRQRRRRVAASGRAKADGAFGAYHGWDTQVSHICLGVKDALQ